MLNHTIIQSLLSTGLPTKEAIWALEDSSATWAVPHDVPPAKATQLGEQYWEEVQELHFQNPAEAKAVLKELFLYGWRAPLQAIQAPPEVHHIKNGDGTSRRIEMAGKSAFVNADIMVRYGVEDAFITALVDAALVGVK